MVDTNGNATFVTLLMMVIFYCFVVIHSIQFDSVKGEYFSPVDVVTNLRRDQMNKDELCKVCF